MKCGRPIGSKYKNPRTIKGAKKKDNSNEDVETIKESFELHWILSSRRTDQIPEIFEKERDLDKLCHEWNEFEPK
jgi:hypothetical protein